MSEERDWAHEDAMEAVAFEREAFGHVIGGKPRIALAQLMAKKREAHRRGWDEAIETAAKATESHEDHVDIGPRPQQHREAPFICGVAEMLRALPYPGPEGKSDK